MCSVVGIKIRQEAGVAAGRDEDVAGRQWLNVHERHGSWAFVNDARREPNETDWVNLISLQLQSVDHIFNGLQTAVKEVLGSKPGVAVFSAEPPAFPESPGA